MGAHKRMLNFGFPLCSSKETRWWAVLGAWLLLASGTGANNGGAIKNYSAIVNITYTDPATGKILSNRSDMGVFGSQSRLESESGIVVHVRGPDNSSHGCTPPVNVPKKDPWIALIKRGNCKFQKKIYNAAVLSNASAVVIYNHEVENNKLTMDHQGEKKLGSIVCKCNSIFTDKNSIS